MADIENLNAKEIEPNCDTEEDERLSDFVAGMYEPPKPADKEEKPKEKADEKVQKIEKSADDAAAAIKKEGPHYSKPMDLIEKTVQLAVKLAPEGKEKEYLDLVAKRLTDKSGYEVKLEPSQFSKDRLRVTIHKPGDEFETSFSVAKKEK